MSKRKLWCTEFTDSATPRVRHESRAAVYRYVEAQRANWQCGALRFHRLNVRVDERDGRGWRLYERIDLSEATP